MRKSRVILFVIILLAGFQLQVSAQGGNYVFSHLSIDDGLAHDHCKSMLKDKDGFMWFGTESGLSRYDGSDFKTYRFQEGDSSTIGDNWINDIKQDETGNIWIACRRGGINKYDPVTDQFTRYPILIQDDLDLPEDELAILYIDSDQKIWYGTYRHGFGWFDPTNGSYQNYNINTNFKNPRHAWEINSAAAIIQDLKKKNIMWIGTLRSGLYRFDKKTESLTYIKNEQEVNGHDIHGLFMNEPGKLWVGYWGAGIGFIYLDGSVK